MRLVAEGRKEVKSLLLLRNDVNGGAEYVCISHIIILIYPDSMSRFSTLLTPLVVLTYMRIPAD